MTINKSHRRITPQTPHAYRPAVSPPSPPIMVASQTTTKTTIYLTTITGTRGGFVIVVSGRVDGGWPRVVLSSFFWGLHRRVVWAYFFNASLWTFLLAIVSGCFSSLFLFYSCLFSSVPPPFNPRHCALRLFLFYVASY